MLVRSGPRRHPFGAVGRDHRMGGMAGTTVTLSGGVEMPLVGLGTWQLSGAAGYNAVRRALDVGYRHLDTATMYLNEAVVGRAVRDSGVPREDIFVTTKLPPARVGQARKTLDESLHDLGTDYVDLWLIHWPPRDGASPGTWQELIAARDARLARAIGVSNYSTAQIDELIAATGEAPAVNQIRWGPTLYDPRRLADSRERAVVVEGYSPFKTTNLRHQVLTEIAEAHGVTTAQVVLRWHLEHETVVIPKSARPERIAKNFDVFSFALKPDEVARINALSPTS
jgi:diketogulonate reductase-like aldo/keto reductase